MGYSTSTPSNFLTKNNHPEENPSYATASQENSTFSLQLSSPQVHRALSLQTPLVHHPPSNKGDSHHLVSLTSTTYGSLLLVEPLNHFAQLQQSPRKFIKHNLKAQITTDQAESFSPDSVINTWELMDGLDDDMDFEIVNPLKQRSSLSPDSIEFSSKACFFPHLGSHGSVKKMHGCFDSVEIGAAEEETKKKQLLRNFRIFWVLFFIVLLVLCYCVLLRVVHV